MPYTTLSSGLTLQIPTRGTRTWADTILAQCFSKISSHDHTGSGKGLPIGASALSSNAVTTAKIADGNVTLAKLANIATDRLIGRDTAGTGVPEALTVGGGVEFSGSGGIQRSALTGDVTAPAGSNSTTIATGAVTEAMLADDAATRSCYLFQSGVDLDTPDGTAAIAEIPLSGNIVVSQIAMPKAGKVTHLSVSLGTAITSGTLTLTLFKNGSTTGKSITITSGTLNHGAITAESFVAGDSLSIAITKASCTFTSGSSNGTAVTAWGHFTA